MDSNPKTKKELSQEELSTVTGGNNKFFTEETVTRDSIREASTEAINRTTDTELTLENADFALERAEERASRAALSEVPRKAS